MLLAVAHGTRSAAGQAQVRALLGLVSRRRPGLAVNLSYVDVQRPRLTEVASRLTHVTEAHGRLARPAVVVPLLLSAGYHVRVDIPTALGTAPAVVAPALGPDPALADLLRRRLARMRGADAVVLAAAGSADARARTEVTTVAAALQAQVPWPVHVGYASAADPRVVHVVRDLRAAGAERIVIAAYLLADGVFYRSLYRTGADAVTAPLGPDPLLADLILTRHDQANTPATHPLAS